MRTDELISALVRDLAPAAALPPPARRVARWMMVPPLSVAAGLLLWGVRHNVSSLRDPAELQLVVLALATTLAAALAALLLAVPGARGAAAMAWAPIGASAIWVALLASRIASSGGSFDGSMAWPYPVCVLKVLSMAVLPGLALIAMVRRNGPLHAEWTMGLAGLAAGAVGSLGAHLACPEVNPAHTLLGHVAPMLALAVLGAVLGRQSGAPTFTP